MTVLLCLMACCVLLGSTFWRSAGREADRLRRSLASGFILKVNTDNEFYQKRIEHERGGGSIIYVGPLIHDEMIEKICRIDGVKDSVAELLSLVWTDLKLRPGLWLNTEADSPEDIEYFKKLGAVYITEEELMIWQYQTILWPCKNGAVHKNFRSGALTITEGRNIEEGDHYKAVICDWLAGENGLSVGDTITVETKEGVFGESREPLKTWGDPVDLEIVGLFHANFSQKASDFTPEDGYIENVIYADMDTYEKLEENMVAGGYENEGEDGYSKVEFLVEDPAEADSIIDQIKHRDDLNLENMDLEVDSPAYRAAIRPYRQIRMFAGILLAAGICGTGMILYLLLKLWVQGRKHEAGILFSIGIGKKEVLGQMLTECLMVSAAALVLAIGLSGPVTGKCADILEQFTAPKAGAEAYRATLSPDTVGPEITKLSADEVVLERTVSAGAVLFTVFFVCGVSGLGVLVSFAGIGRLDPKKLLM